MPFQCSICEEESTRICARCTKDACNNHLCEKCRRCSDCCECEVVLNGQPPSARSVLSRHEPPAEIAEASAVQQDDLEMPFDEPVPGEEDEEEEIASEESA